MNLAKSFQKADQSDETEYLSDSQQIRYTLDDDEINHAKKWGRLRHESYSSGATRDEAWGDSLPGMQRGVAAEMVLALLYEECEFDTYLGADGDDGSDGQLEIGGVVEAFDVKSIKINPSDRPHTPKLLYATHHMDERDVPPVLVSAYVAEDLSEVRLLGWIRTSDFLEESEIANALNGGDHLNYELPVSELESMPESTKDIAGVDGATLISL